MKVLGVVKVNERAGVMRRRVDAMVSFIVGYVWKETVLCGVGDVGGVWGLEV